MTAKDFLLIAKIIRGTTWAYSERNQSHIAHVFAQQLAEQFPRFDYERFVSACISNTQTESES